MGSLHGACRSQEIFTQSGVYSCRHHNTDKDLYARFTEATCI